MSLHSTPPGGLPETLRPSHDQIAARAYRIYAENGCNDGHDLEHWLQAERSLIQEVAVPLAAQAPVLALEQISKPDEPDVHAVEPNQPQFARDGRGSASRKETREQPSPTSATRQSVRPAERAHRQRLQNAA